MAQTIENEQMFYLNHSATTGMYGKSQFWDIYYHTKDCHFLYKIKDTIFDEETNSILDVRDCVPIDMLTVEKGDKVLNKYRIFKKEVDSVFSSEGGSAKTKIFDSAEKSKIFASMEKKYITDEKLLEEYWLTYEKSLEQEAE